MAFHEVQFPAEISYGSSGGPGFNTIIVETDSGAEERSARWSSARRRYSAEYGIRGRDDISSLITFYMGRRGSLYGFRYKDWPDYTTASDGVSAPAVDDAVIGTGDGAETQFQLSKTYTSGAGSITRNITKPVTSSVLVAVNAVTKTEGVDFTVDTTTGIVTFTVAPTATHSITAGCEFDVPCRFGKGADALLSVSLDDYDISSIGSIEIVEITDETPVAGEYWMGGAADITTAAAYTLSVSSGRVLTIDATVASLKIYLPSTTGLPAGGPYFVIIGAIGANDFDVAIDATQDLVTVSDGDVVTIYLADGGTWVIV